MSSLSFAENILSTNGAPSDEDHKTLARLVAEHENRISILNRQIATLEAERTALVEALAPLKRANFPFRRLPDDVLRAIFMECLDHTRNPTMAHTETPVLLTRISSYTRRLALASPELWAALHIPIMTPSSTNNAESKAIMAARVRGVEEWLLRRSGTMPLRISVHEPCSRENPPGGGWNNPFAHRVIAVLLKCRARWRDMSFLLVSLPAVQRITVLTAADCPLLRSVSLHGITPGLSWKKSHLFGGPALQKFSTALVEPCNGAPIYIFNVNWENITHLCLRGMFIGRHRFNDTPFKKTFTTTLRSILRQATQLVSLDTAIISTIDIGGDLDLPFLKALKVSEEYEDDYCRGILEQIRAPQLETVTYSVTLDHQTPPPSLIVLLTHATKVQEMSITLPHKSDVGAVPHASVYRPILTLCPLLKTLHIGQSGEILAIDLLGDLAGDPVAGGTQLCPELEFFRCDSTLIVSPQALYDFFKGKHDDLSGGTRWKSVMLHVCFRDEDIHPTFAEFRRVIESPGVDLRITTKMVPPKSRIKRPLDEGAVFLWDNWSPPSFPRPVHAGFDCLVDV